jgi:hypothetical protein
VPNPKTRSWAVNKSGTRYVKQTQVVAPREKAIDPEAGKQLVSLLTGEAVGDIDLAILLAIRNMLAEPKRWNPHRRATGVEGETDPVSHTARAWSLFGALECVVTPGFEKRKREVLGCIRVAVPKDDNNSQSLTHWEPGTTHSKLLWVLNMAIANRKKTLNYEGRN